MVFNGNFAEVRKGSSELCEIYMRLHYLDGKVHVERVARDADRAQLSGNGDVARMYAVVATALVHSPLYSGTLSDDGKKFWLKLRAEFGFEKTNLGNDQWALSYDRVYRRPR